MAIHWTDFPQRVEKFGDLFNILETLDADHRTDYITGRSFAKRTPQAAYVVAFGVDGGYQFHSVNERMPGITRIITFVEREYGCGMSLEILRRVRGRVSEALDIDFTAVNELTLVQVADALDTASREPATQTPASDYLLSEFRWLKVKQIAQVFALTPSQVTKPADAGTFVTNGKSGYDRRIDVLSVIRRELERLKEQASISED
jgi:hypothetical protein